MPFAFSSSGASDSSPSRPVVAGLFVASCLLALVSWYTTFEGMRLYLNAWFALLASAGIQVSLVLVAWRVGFGRARRALLMAVYAVTACVSIAFSYVSLYTWFAERERPAEIQRGLYDKISTATGAAGEILSGAALEARRHGAALTEMAEAEKTVGHISRAQDADPYLASVREAVSTEARTYGASYQEGAGAGLRYTAFERYAKLARQSLDQIEASQKALAGFRTQLRPTQSSEEQLRAFRQVYDTIPWAEAERQLHSGSIKRSEVPDYASNLDKTSGGQEDLLLAFAALGAPTGRHIFALLLAAFIDRGRLGRRFSTPCRALAEPYGLAGRAYRSLGKPPRRRNGTGKQGAGDLAGGLRGQHAGLAGGTALDEKLAVAAADAIGLIGPPLGPHPFKGPIVHHGEPHRAAIAHQNRHRATVAPFGSVQNLLRVVQEAAHRRR